MNSRKSCPRENTLLDEMPEIGYQCLVFYKHEKMTEALTFILFYFKKIIVDSILVFIFTFVVAPYNP
jgi:hypothetical protein